MHGAGKVIVAQLGARRHYAVPLAFHSAGALRRLYTDLYAGRGVMRLAGAVGRWSGGAAMKRLGGRADASLPPSMVRHFPAFGLEYRWRVRRAWGADALSAAWLWGGRRFCELVIRAGIDDAAAVYGFNSASLEIFQHAHERSIRTVLDQTIAPRSLEHRILQEESARFPEWGEAEAEGEHIAAYCRREEVEWREADRIICGSAFVRDSIAAAGGPADRCIVAPYGIKARFEATDRPQRREPLRVLVVGTVGLRKGTPYVMEAARRLKNVAQFRIVGPVNVPAEAQRQLRECVELSGMVPRSEMADQYRWADVFLLPSLIEGSAGAVYEAMASGLPVICTANTGSIVRHDMDGLVLPMRDVDAIVEAIALLADDPGRRREMGATAAHYVRQFDVDRYARQLLDAAFGQLAAVKTEASRGVAAAVME